ncbi:putative reverse transcriptase domain-containing protein [Tanacetum coccineum]|uniref:Reverse transcriptase domain-containing protein n=1 Tax=Tanacetum coccineum TaxID=301880 RepID=A0ABQ4XJL9_9ASTR
MPPRRFKKKFVRKIVEKHVAKAIEKYEKTRADSNNTGGSGSTNTRGTVVPEMHGCSYKTFMNGKPHSFKGTEGVVGLKRWFKKMEQVFEILQMSEMKKDEVCLCDPELVSTKSKKIEKYICGFLERIKGNITSSKPATLHEAINMARELSINSFRPQLEGRFILENLPKCNQCTTPSWTVSSKVPEMSKNRTFQGDMFPKAGTTEMNGARGRAYVVIENPQQNPNVVTDLLPTRLGSFDVIIGMDWLAYHRALIDCYEKIVRIPLPNGEILEVQGERPEKDLGSLACIKADEKKLDDIRVVHGFPEVFPDDLLGLPHEREVEFRIDLIPGASPVVRSPYRLAPSEMLELSNQLKELQEKGFIRPSHSPWGAPVLFVKKKDGSMRMCVLFLQDRSSFGISPVKSSRRRYTEDRI